MYRDHRDLTVLTHSFPTRRSSDLDRADRRRSDGRGLRRGDRRDAEAARRDAGLYPAAQAVRYPDREIPGPPAPHGRHVHGGGAGTLDDDHGHAEARPARSEEHTSELQSLLRISYAVFCLKK